MEIRNFLLYKCTGCAFMAGMTYATRHGQMLMLRMRRCYFMYRMQVEKPNKGVLNISAYCK